MIDTYLQFDDLFLYAYIYIWFAKNSNSTTNGMYLLHLTFFLEKNHQGVFFVPRTFSRGQKQNTAQIELVSIRLLL